MVRERVGDWRLAWRFALAGVVAGLLVIALVQTGAANPTFDAAQDQFFPAPAPDPQISFVAIDSRTVQALGAYPYNNAYHARVIDYLASLHPKVILFDIVLDHVTGLDAETGTPTDQPLTEAISRAGNVVLVCTVDNAPRGEFSTVAAAVGERGLGFPDAANTVRGVVLRPTPRTTCPENESAEPAFMLALRVATGVSSPIQVNSGEATFGNHHIPLVGDEMLINFTRGTGHSCSYVDAFNGSCPRPDLITNHIVVVGVKLIDAGDVWSQAVSFPHDPSFCSTNRPHCMLDSQNFGYRIQADAMSTVLDERYVRVIPPVPAQLVLLLLSAIVGLIVYLLSFRAGMLLTAAVLVAYYGVVYVLGQQGYLADALSTPFAIVLAATFSLGARYVLEERERRKVERIFGQYIDPRVARQLAATRSVDDLISRGERRDLTVLFMDIRGFTTMSESMAADDVLAVIQDYLDEMSALILKWDGLIDKYVGDEIMAMWNVPLAQPDHALLAIRCSYDLVSGAGEMQARLAARGLPPISYGIGINTGPAVVGNMGSQERLQYTALGDTVNTGARFCAAAPPFNVLIGKSTYDACADYIAVDEVPGLQLKGKSAETFRVFKVTAIREDKESPWVPMPTEAATAEYDAWRRLHATGTVAR
ncbi:MAG TPA: adenylate/guanylate cyclase domain-containing protein [Candidatus Limnocylindrales bacterium]|nr:adenylate/guanylate cyclase domain-containing protein [Candidatus Limnocylindrales bacterium]